VLAWDFVDYPEPHLERTRALLKAHPEVRGLFGHERSTALWVVAIVAVQIAIAIALRAHPWWAVLLLAYGAGPLPDHALWTMINACPHILVLKRPSRTTWLKILGSLPLVCPAAISSGKFRLLPPRCRGDLELDADLASPLEAKLVGNSTVRKGLWLLTFFA